MINMKNQLIALFMAWLMCFSMLPLTAFAEENNIPACTCEEFCTECEANIQCPVCAEDIGLCAGLPDSPIPVEDEPEADPTEEPKEENIEEPIEPFEKSLEDLPGEITEDPSPITEDEGEIVPFSIEGPEIIASGNGGEACSWTLTVSGSTTLNNMSGKTVAILSSSGKVSTTSIAPAGLELIITATAQGTAPDETVADTCTVTVAPIATAVQITGESTTVSVGDVIDLDATVLPNGDQEALQSVTWKTSNTKIATVDANGNVTAKKKGTVTITATAGDESGKKATVNIMITA